MDFVEFFPTGFHADPLAGVFVLGTGTGSWGGIGNRRGVLFVGSPLALLNGITLQRRRCGSRSCPPRKPICDEEQECEAYYPKQRGEEHGVTTGRQGRSGTPAVPLQSLFEKYALTP